MSSFIIENPLLQSKSAEKLYHDYVATLPIVDYYCHLPPEEIAKDKNFENLTNIWLNGDHYKWRAINKLASDICYYNAREYLNYNVK